jgi:hypothetical protein
MTRQYSPDAVEWSPREQARHRDGLDLVAALMARRTDPDWERLGGSVTVPRWWQPPGVTDEEMDTAIARGLWRWEGVNVGEGVSEGGRR